MKSINTFELDKIKKLKVGETVLLSGEIFLARDRVLKKMEDENIFPKFLKDKIIYHSGPTQKNIYGFFSAGPTTSKRMDKFLKFLFENQILGTIGKGERDIDIHKAYGKIYFLAFGGLGSLYGSRIKSLEPVLFKSFKSEAMFKAQIEDFPLIVAIDVYKKRIQKGEKNVNYRIDVR